MLRDTLYDDVINMGNNTNESVCLFYRMTVSKLSTLLHRSTEVINLSHPDLYLSQIKAKTFEVNLSIHAERHLMINIGNNTNKSVCVFYC